MTCRKDVVEQKAKNIPVCTQTVKLSFLNIFIVEGVFQKPKKIKKRNQAKKKGQKNQFACVERPNYLGKAKYPALPFLLSLN